jgi:hypothetical protein
MSLSGTYTPQGTTILGESIYIDSAPDLYIQDTRGAYFKSPDGDGFYWGMSGSAAYPVYKIGCFSDFVFGDEVTMNDVICDVSGVEAIVQKRGSLHVNFTLKSLFPLTVLTHLIRAGAVTQNTSDGAEKMGIGDLTRKTLYWRIYFTKVYNDEGDFLSVTCHKCQFYDTWELATPYGDSWTIPITTRVFADSTMPVAQRFATMIRVDPSVIV